MSWSATLSSERIERERGALRQRREQVEAAREREIEEICAKYAAELRNLDEELADLDRFERIAMRFAEAPQKVEAERNEMVHYRPAVLAGKDTAQLVLDGSSGAPTQKAMALQAVQENPQGIDRPRVVQFIREHFGVELNPGNVTTALYRLRTEDNLVRTDGRLWFPANPSPGEQASGAGENITERSDG